jgi:hypothetical protein
MEGRTRSRTYGLLDCARDRAEEGEKFAPGSMAGSTFAFKETDCPKKLTKVAKLGNFLRGSRADSFRNQVEGE